MQQHYLTAKDKQTMLFDQARLAEILKEEHAIKREKEKLKGKTGKYNEEVFDIDSPLDEIDDEVQPQRGKRRSKVKIEKGEEDEVEDDEVQK